RQETGVVRAELTAQQRGYMTVQGDTYASIAAAHQIDEQDLRALNDNVQMRPGRNLKIPVKRVVIKATRPVSAQPVAATPEVQEAPAVPVRDQGLVRAVDTRDAPRAAVVNTTSAEGTYVVQKGDSIWGIAQSHGVDQQKLMEVNGISDPRKLQTGMTLRIP
ncbi:MAG: LysM peptidoglycan-binding domain-containing protein, partial [Akkermansiaceae bacterium]|nr:LysM peptidoglycan-binding domain-containing protein [Akkermansiaceae bacterium]